MTGMGAEHVDMQVGGPDGDAARCIVGGAAWGVVGLTSTRCFSRMNISATWWPYVKVMSADIERSSSLPISIRSHVTASMRARPRDSAFTCSDPSGSRSPPLRRLALGAPKRGGRRFLISARSSMVDISTLWLREKKVMIRPSDSPTTSEIRSSRRGLI